MDDFGAVSWEPLVADVLVDVGEGLDFGVLSSILLSVSNTVEELGVVAS